MEARKRRFLDGEEESKVTERKYKKREKDMYFDGDKYVCMDRQINGENKQSLR